MRWAKASRRKRTTSRRKSQRPRRASFRPADRLGVRAGRLGSSYRPVFAKAAAQSAPIDAGKGFAMAAKGEGLVYKRLLVKLSGEALMGGSGYGLDMAVVNRLAGDVKQAIDAGAEIAVVVGG